MRILFTGGSSFTGYWFIKSLAEAGHDVVAVFRKPATDYSEEARQARVARLATLCRPVYGAEFGDEAFLQLIRDEAPFDRFCHHAADVTNYKSLDFDYQAATANNTRNCRQVLSLLAARGCGSVVATGSVFEGGEGAGSQGLPAFSPYGLSKELSWRIFEYFAGIVGVHLGKFVIPNPFGPYEDPRFTHYLLNNWSQGLTPTVQTPAYIRDNIHVSLLARAYVQFVEECPAIAGVSRLNPSGYVESQGRFALRFAAELRGRLTLECGLNLAEQREFAEPRFRVNTDPVDGHSLGWSESAAWDELADYYAAKYRCARRA